MGFSREPADFAFIAFVKTKTSDIDSTEGKNVLKAMQADSQIGSQAREKSREGLIGNAESSFGPTKGISREGLISNSGSSSNQAKKISREGLIGNSDTVARQPKKVISNSASPSSQTTEVNRNLIGDSDSSAKIRETRRDMIAGSPDLPVKFIAAKTNTAVETYKGTSVNVTA
jgi:hypothetical protein